MIYLVVDRKVDRPMPLRVVRESVFSSSQKLILFWRKICEIAKESIIVIL